jgi:hypothetical protein
MLLDWDAHARLYEYMIYRIARILLEVVGIAVGGMLVVAALAVWRLSSAPVESRYIGDYLEEAIKNAHLGFAAQVKNARIEWHGFRPIVGVQFQGVSIVGEGGAPVAAFRDGTLGISARDLLFGRFSILEIDIRNPEITVIRDPDDHFSLRVGQQSGTGSGNADFAAFIQNFLERPSDNGPLGKLRRVHLVNGRITVDDQKTGGKWSAPNVDIDLARDAQATSGKIDIALDLPQHPARLFARARHVLGERRNYISVDIEGFNAAAAAPFAAALSPLAPFAIPVSGHAHAVIDDSGSLVSGDIELSGAKGGMIVLPQFYSGPLVVKGLDVKAHFTGAPQVLVLDRMAVDLGDAKISAKGTANFAGQNMTIDSQLDLATVPLARFDALWPHGMAVGGRDWVTAHIPDGIIKSGSVHIGATGKTDDPGSIQITSVAGTFDYTGLEVHYFPPLPPIRGIDGHATFDVSRMALSIDTGQLGALAVSKGSAVLTNLDQDENNIDIDLTVAGPLKSALATLDMKPLGYARDLGLTPDGVGGKAELQASFSFPMIKSLLFKQIALQAKGTLDGVSAPNVIGSRPIDAGKFDIALDKAGMRLNGSAKLAGVPMSLDWKESFLQTDKTRSRITFESAADDAQRAALAFNPPDLVGLKGKIGVKGAVTIDRDHTTTLDLNADIGAAELTVDKIALRKAAGDPATADLSLVFEGDTLAHIPRLRVASKDLTIDGDIDLGPDDAFRRARLTRVTSPRNDFTLLAEAKPSDAHAYSVSVSGAKFDAAPLISAKSSGGPPDHTPRLDLKVALDTLLTGAEAHLDNVSGTAAMTGTRLDRANLKATAGGPMTLTYVPGGDGRTLTFSADDAGKTLAALGLTRGARGGILRIDGTTDTSREPWRTKGTLAMKDFRMTDAPIMARLVNAISITGMVDLLSGQGLGFDRLEAGIEYAGGTFTFRDGRAAGTLGISFEGEVNQNKDTVALKGTVVPVDTFNRIVSSIPLVGGLLTGGNRGGLFGWTYTISGTTNDPNVSVNPLSIFAPGVLRNLFFLGPAEPDSKDDQPTDKPDEKPAAADQK